MGFGWAIFMPLVNTAMFSVIFMRVAPHRHRRPVPAVRLQRPAGLELLRVVAPLRGDFADRNSNLVTKVYFPREIFPFSAVLVSLVDSPSARSCLSAMMVYYHVASAPAILSPAGRVAGPHGVHAAAWRCSLAMANLFYRDVKYLFEVVITRLDVRHVGASTRSSSSAAGSGRCCVSIR